MKWLIVILLLNIFASVLTSDCLAKDFGEGSVVCVCNDQHCDKIPKVEKTDPSSYIIYTSDKAGQRFNSTKNDFRPINPHYVKNDECKDSSKDGQNNNKSITITIDQSVKYQSILGWGGAFSDSTGINIKSLNENLQNELLRSYFSDEGLEYNLGRVPIGGTDFSTRGYTYLDTLDDNDYNEDPLLTGFKLAEEDFLYKIPLIKEAQKLSDNLLLLGSCWTSPKWMKENRDYNGVFGYLRKEMYRPWANYYVKFLDAYRNQNVSFWGITTGNEIYFALTLRDIPGILWTPEEMKHWLRWHFGPTIRNSSYSDIKILANDDNRPLLTHSLSTLFSDKINLEYIDGAAIHWYFDTKYNAFNLEETHREYPDKFMLYTEACNFAQNNRASLGNWQNAEKYANNIIENLNNWVVGWMEWNMALDLNGGPTYINNSVESSITVNASGQEFFKQPSYYAIGHFSKFLPRDSVRIYSSRCDPDLEIVALKRPDGGVAVIILNQSNDIQRRTIVDSAKGEISLNVSPHSISTILYW
ncbi:unnamed protein product [Phyllotreta striolata]|uniref:Glucosylceramidase n=1 Tax=Phyllotreta striolata TaxID=444603 RepID=A0A9N9TEZ4_PHYSR|nr:unnamed protein product [Phyllotreta striolata]